MTTFLSLLVFYLLSALMVSALATTRNVNDAAKLFISDIFCPLNYVVVALAFWFDRPRRRRH